MTFKLAKERNQKTTNNSKWKPLKHIFVAKYLALDDTQGGPNIILLNENIFIHNNIQSHLFFFIKCDLCYKTQNRIISS